MSTNLKQIVTIGVMPVPPIKIYKSSTFKYLKTVQCIRKLLPAIIFNFLKGTLDAGDFLSGLIDKTPGVS